jgi:hypothetical protein
MRNRKCRAGMVALCFSLLLSVRPVCGADDPSQGPANQSLQAQHVFDANVTIAEMLNFGKSKYGERHIIPITGGTFKGPNRALIHPPTKDSKTGPYVRSVIDFEAPSTSSYDWLNHAIFLGTLTVPQPMPKDKHYVIIGVYKVL